MKLFATPQMTTLEDGSVKVEAQAITPEYIDDQINNYRAIGGMNVDDVIMVIRQSKTSQEAKENLASSFQIEETVAEFILGMELAEVTEYIGSQNKQDRVYPFVCEPAFPLFRNLSTTLLHDEQIETD